MATELLSKELPNIDPPILTYLSGYIDDPTSHLEPNAVVLNTVAAILSSYLRTSYDDAAKASAKVDEILKGVQGLLPEEVASGEENADGPLRLENVVEMQKVGALNTRGHNVLTGGNVDIATGSVARATNVDVRKLEKQEAKTKAKLAKRAQRDLYESSNLVEQTKRQQELENYEEMFTSVNTMETIGAKGKNKDINLPGIDLNFGSHRILTNATLTLASGRRYGLIGRNGVGKSTLLRHLALRDVPVPKHISMLYVEQEMVGDDTPALTAVLKADVWRDRLLREESDLNGKLESLEKKLAGATSAKQATEESEAQDGGDLSKGTAPDIHTRQMEIQKDELSGRLLEVQSKLVEMEADTGPSRAAALLDGLGIVAADQMRPTKSFSGGWRMRLALARALFCKPDLLLLDEPSNNLDLVALSWLEDYLVNEWEGTLLVVSHDVAFLDSVATDIIHQHSERLDYYRGNYAQFHETRLERRKNQQREYEAYVMKRDHLQAFIDRWRVNANRAAQAQSKIKELEKLQVVEPPEKEDEVTFRLPETEQLNPPLLLLDAVDFGYTADRPLLQNIDIGVTMDSRIAVVGPNGAGKSTMLKLLFGELQPTKGEQKRNGKLRIGYFTQHTLDMLDGNASPVGFLAAKFPGRSEQEYRSHLGAFGITGTTGLQKIGTLSGGQKSRVSFAFLAMQRPHVLLLDEPTNHLDMAGLQALQQAIQRWNGGVLTISHDAAFIQGVASELWVVHDKMVEKYPGDVNKYKQLIVSMNKERQTSHR
ncbi:unnamed protein product [Jaminaea pallidilutea]